MFTIEPSGSFIAYVLNVGRSHQEGFELEARLRPTNDLTVGLNYGYLRSRYDEFMDFGVNVADNRSVQFAPRNTVNVVLDGVLARTSNGTLRATLDYRYTSKYFQAVLPLRPTVPPSALAGDNVIRADGLLNGRLAFGEMNWGHGISGEVALWGRNLTDRVHIDSGIDFGPIFGNLRVANFSEPRTFGVTITTRW